ncbi:MAG: hypothetical protein HDT27_09150 [Subdoligranulum sp.]|nr:hypothetical protein [Subdoligranulum sp.]
MKKKRVLWIGCGIVLAAGVLLAALFLFALGRGIDSLAGILSGYFEREEARSALFQSIVDDVAASEPLFAGASQVGLVYTWGMETPDKTKPNYFFLPDSLFDDYCKYWLEGIDPSVLYEGYNQDLWETGDPVFYAIHISKTTFPSDTDVEGIPLKAGVDYYFADIYDKAIYYQYVSRYQDAQHYTALPEFRCFEYGAVKSWLYHQEDGEWVKEALPE